MHVGNTSERPRTAVATRWWTVVATISITALTVAAFEIHRDVTAWSWGAAWSEVLARLPLYGALFVTCLAIAAVRSRALLHARREASAADAELLRRRALLHALSSALPSPIFVKDADGVYVECNDAFLELLGKPREEVVGRTSRDVAPSELAQRFERADRALHEEGGTQIYEERVRTAAGGEIDFLFRKARVETDEGEALGLVGIMLDVGELKDRERSLAKTRDTLREALKRQSALTHELRGARRRAESAAKAKSAFLAHMSHEIRTPLNAILGSADLLGGRGLAPEQREHVEVIASSGTALAQLVSDILELSRVETNEIELASEPVSLAGCIEQVLDVAAPEARRKRLEIGYEIAPGIPDRVLGDGGRIRRILLHLVTNAVKYTERGEVLVEVCSARPGVRRDVGSREELGGARRVVFCVRDTGCGIPQDRLEELFEPFVQGDSSTRRTHEGAGLGLALSRSLARAMGGDVRAEVRELGGSVFRFEMPLSRAPDGDDASSDGTDALSGRRILVRIRNHAVARIAAGHLSRWGSRAIVAHDEAELRRALRTAGPIDAALVDVCADCTGVCTTIDAIDETVAPVPIVALRWPRSVTRAPCIERVVTVTKPLKPRLLQEALGKALGAGAEAGASDAGPSVDALEILLAEDNLVNQRVALKMLARLGAHADVVVNGIDVLAAVSAKTYDLILMDLRMPVVDGLEATRRIRARSITSQPKIFAITADALPEHRDACLAAGMDGFLAKPLKLEELERALETVVQSLASADTGDARLVSS
jgi:PAS domain S-box-containing protein